MRYPCYCNYIKISEFSYEKGTFLINDFYHNKTSTASREEIELAKKFDGKTDPRIIIRKSSFSDVDGTIALLVEKNLIRKSNILSRGIFKTMISLKKIYEHGKYSSLCRVLNALLMISFAPLLAAAFLYKRVLPIAEVEPAWLVQYRIPVFAVVLLLNLFLNFFVHEMAHAVACSGYHGKTYEFGYVFPLPMFYVLMDPEHEVLKSRLYRVQIYLAGIEANAIVVAMWLVLAKTCAYRTIADISWLCASTSLSFILINSLFIRGFDGRKAIQALLGISVDNGLSFALRNSWKKLKSKKESLHTRINGFVTILAMALLTLLGIGITVVLIIEEFSTLSTLFTNRLSL